MTKATAFIMIRRQFSLMYRSHCTRTRFCKSERASKSKSLLIFIVTVYTALARFCKSEWASELLLNFTLHRPHCECHVDGASV